MKIAALISTVAASRQARDALSLFEKSFGGGIIQEKTIQGSTDTLLLPLLQFYLGNSGLFQVSSI